MKIIAVIPVHGRIPLLKHTITRLYEKNKVHRVICVGGDDEKSTCLKYDAEFIKHENILGSKWNRGFIQAKRRRASHVLFVGSSDMICDNYLDIMIPHCPEYGMMGTKGFHMAHIEKNGTVRAGKWHGYHNRNESIGIGRIISEKILDKIRWKPFNDNKNNGMDREMQQKVLSKKGTELIVDFPDAISLSISTDQWNNKHKYADKTGSFTEFENPIEFLTQYFPETLKIFHNEM